ncbi:hypothetical protein [Flammeovirga sp. SubArs3]|uniref:hypothetical protein n=1 Tax=Flammeovirga sp. SubArs3 TaxID=2995316 RepID=UPI00248D38BC|nr:hypothetical protein [Flammeovirga sp. SubArs3]
MKFKKCNKVDEESLYFFDDFYVMYGENKIMIPSNNSGKKTNFGRLEIFNYLILNKVALMPILNGRRVFKSGTFYELKDEGSDDLYLFFKLTGDLQIVILNQDEKREIENHKNKFYIDSNYCIDKESFTCGDSIVLINSISKIKNLEGNIRELSNYKPVNKLFVSLFFME